MSIDFDDFLDTLRASRFASINELCSMTGNELWGYLRDEIIEKTRHLSDEKTEEGPSILSNGVDGDMRKRVSKKEKEIIERIIILTHPLRKLRRKK